MELFKLLPDYYENNKTMETLQGIVSAETDVLEEKLGFNIAQCFVETAVGKSLSRYEKILGLTTDTTKSDRYRRERIKSKMVSAGTTTKSLVEHISSSYVNAEVEVRELFDEYGIVIKFVGTVGIPENLPDIKESIREAIPAHLRAEYEYVYNTYGSFRTMTHGQMTAYTHLQLRGGRLGNRIELLQEYQHAELAQLTHKEIAKGELPNGN